MTKETAVQDRQTGFYVIIPQSADMPKVAYVYEQAGRLFVRAEQLGDRDLDRGLYQGWSWGPRINLSSGVQ